MTAPHGLPYEPIVSRRTTLAWVTAAIGVAQLPRQATGAPLSAQGYGADPKLDLYVAPWPRLLSRAQLAQLAVLADLILPPDEHAPAPSALGVPDFVDEWISAPYPTQIEDRNVLVDGLGWLDQEAIRLGAASWVAALPDQRHAIVAAIASGASRSVPDATLHFFRRLRSLIVGAYFTTDKGIAALGYVGNVALESYPSVSGSLATELDARMRKLGLT